MNFICSRCGKPIRDITIKITSHYEILKNTEVGTVSEFNNVSEVTSEYLCGDCFDKYCECLDSLNTCPAPVELATEIVDDVQYGEEDII